MHFVCVGHILLSILMDDVIMKLSDYNRQAVVFVNISFFLSSGEQYAVSVYK